MIMKIVQKMILGQFVLILISFISYTYSEEGSGSTNECLQDKPKLGPNDNLEIGFFYDQYPEGHAGTKMLYECVCGLIGKCGNNISIKLYPGAGVTVDDAGKMVCDPAYCDADRGQVCAGIIDADYLVKCKSPPQNIEDCMTNNLEEVDSTLKENGKKRIDAGIPDSALPVAITFKDKYDPCFKLNSCGDLTKYVSELYDNKLECCK